MVTKQAAIETAPETMLISSECCSVKPGKLPQRRAVIEDDVDADELLEHRQHDADPDDRSGCRGSRGRLPVRARRRGAAGGRSLKVASDLLELRRRDRRRRTGW